MDASNDNLLRELVDSQPAIRDHLVITAAHNALIGQLRELVKSAIATAVASGVREGTARLDFLSQCGLDQSPDELGRLTTLLDPNGHHSWLTLNWLMHVAVGVGFELACTLQPFDEAARVLRASSLPV